MKTNRRVYCAVVAVLAAHAAAVHAQEKPADDTANAAAAAPSGLTEVIVTAQRRTENAQNVPITLQTLTSETLQQLQIVTFDDMVKYLPNVTFASNGPGQGEIYMRGLSTGEGGVQGSGTLSSFPNVAIYLDDQSAQLPGRNLDIYAADLERIEILEGPQGTLFGAGAEAGVVRYITNKPKLNVTAGSVNASYSTTAHGDDSAGGDAMINLPLVQDHLAARFVIYDERRGGYIRNLPATFARSDLDKVSVLYFGGTTPPNAGPINNYQLASNSPINPVTYKGARAELLWQIDDNWSALLSQSYQDMDAEGVFWQEEYDGLGNALPPYSVNLFNPNDNRDKFENTALTINGRIAALQFVYAGAYLDRTTDQTADYTNYSRGHYAGYYQCNYPGYPFNQGFYTAANAPNPGLVGVAIPTPGTFKGSNAYPGMGVSSGFCYSPSAFWVDNQTNTHQSHEMRLSTPDDWRLRGLVGVFWEDYVIREQTDWHYGSSPNFVPIAPPAGTTVSNPNVRLPGDVFFNDIERGYEQTAAFTSIDFDLLPHTLILTAGTRWYDIRNFERGANVGSFGCEIYGPYYADVPASPCTIPPAGNANGNNLDAKNLEKSYTGAKSRANLSWHVTDDKLLYYTWSQGFRPGGFNRAVAVITSASPLYGIFQPPIAFGPDFLTNNELGWKTQWFDHHLQWNGAIYQENWKDVQIEIFDPGITGNLTFTTNGPDYRVRGVETSFEWLVIDGLTLTGAAAWNSSEVYNTLSLINPHTGQPIDIANPFGAVGTPLANSPPFQGNLRARYEWAYNDYHPFVQMTASHTGGSYSTTDHLSVTLQGNSVVYYDAGYTTYAAALGVSRDDWTVQLYGDNLTDTRGIPYAFYQQWVKADMIIRPRTIGVRFSWAAAKH